MTLRGSLTLEERIKARGRALGFDLVGITTADPFPEAAAAYQRWIEGGMHAGMAYMAGGPHSGRGERAGDPRRVRETARSIVAVAMNYHTSEPAPSPDGRTPPVEPDPPPGGELRGRIARHAWGDDYHVVMKARLRALSGFLVDHGANLTRYYVDTGPLFERAIAQRAGLGWCGRHSCLITEPFGTWVVLGEIVTDLPLQPDPPVSGDCGSCEACMRGVEACPTGAIVAPGVVDARQCIAYWTIEHRGWIPREVRPALQDMIFGCDLCQEACPFNGPPRLAAHQEFLPRPGTGPRPRLLSFLNIAEDEFRRFFRRSSIRRARRGGLRRNVAVALGNLGDERAVPDLTVALRDPDDTVVRGHTAWALGRIGGTAARAALGAALEAEEDAQVRAEIQVALA